MVTVQTQPPVRVVGRRRVHRAHRDRGRRGGPVLVRCLVVAATTALALAAGGASAAALDGPSPGQEEPTSTSLGEGPASTSLPEGPASSHRVIDIARQYNGVPYVWGGGTPAGFDCSGFVQYVFVQVGIDLPRTADLQAGAGYRIPAAEAVAGDLVWWPGHIGIYTGDGHHIAARSPGTLVHESPIYMADPTFIRVSEQDLHGG